MNDVSKHVSADRPCCSRSHEPQPVGFNWRECESCVRAYGEASIYFGPGELTNVHCHVHGDVRVRSDREAEKNTAGNVAHVGGLLGEALERQRVRGRR